MMSAANDTSKRKLDHTNLMPKTDKHEWCPMCGGGGAWIERLSRDANLVKHICERCSGTGIVLKYPAQQRTP